MFVISKEEVQWVRMIGNFLALLICFCLIFLNELGNELIENRCHAQTIVSAYLLELFLGSFMASEVEYLCHFEFWYLSVRYNND